MPNADRISVASPVLASEELETNIQTGNKTTFIYEGSRDEMLTQRLVEKFKGAAYLKLSSRGDGVYQLIATYNYDTASGEGSQSETPQDVHDLETTMDTVSAFNSPKLYASLLAAFGGADTSVKAALAMVQTAVNQFRNEPDTGVSSGATIANAQKNAEQKIAALFPANSTAQALMISLFRNVALLGVETVVQFNNTYRRSITAATPSQVQASRTGEGLIWTSAEITAFENLPAFWWFTLPSGLQWLKSPCNVNMVAGGKTRIDYHYIGFKQASGLFYTAYNSATLLP